MPTACGLAASPTLSGSVAYEYINQTGQAINSIPYATINFNDDLNKTLSFHIGLESSRTNTLPVSNTMNYADIELKNKIVDGAIGQPNYTPGNGFVASISGLNSLKAAVNDKNMSLTSFYSDDGQRVFGSDFNYANFGGKKNLSLDCAVADTGNTFVGLTLTAKIARKASLCIETADDLNSQENGYQVTTSYGKIDHPRDAIFSVAYRDVQSGAVSQYCVDSNYNDSKGFRIATTYKISSKLTVSAYQDFVRAQNNSDKDESVIVLSQDY
jgi:hypothetical protein